MAKILIGSVTVDMNNAQLYPFPQVLLKRNKGFLFFLRTLPGGGALPDKGYFLVIPLMELAGVTYERPLLCKWFPKAFDFAFKISTPEKFGDPVPTRICVYPVTPFRNYQGFPVDVSLEWEDNEEEQPVVLV